jgi:MFS family permease
VAEAPSSQVPAEPARLTVDISEEDRRRQLRIVFFTVFIDLVGFSIVFPLFPAMLHHYLIHEGPQSLLGQLVTLLRSLTYAGSPDQDLLVTVLFGGMLGSLYSLLQFLVSPFLGRLSDRHGRRPLLIATILGNTIGYLTWAFSGSFALLVLSRVINGVMSGNFAVASAAIADSTTRATRARGMALIGVAFGLGFLFGPPIGGLASLVDLGARYPSLTRFGINPFSLPALCATTLSLFNLLRVISALPETRPPELRGAVVDTPGRQLDLRRAAAEVRIGSLVNLLFTLGFSGLEFTITFFAAERLGYGPAQNTRIFLFLGLLLILTQGVIARRLAHRLGERALTIGGLALGLGAFLALAFAQGPIPIYAGLALLGVGSGLIHPSLSALVSLYSGEAEQGQSLGTFRAAGALARGIGPVLAAVAYWKLGSRTAYLIGSTMALAPLALSLWLPHPRR